MFFPFMISDKICANVRIWKMRRIVDLRRQRVLVVGGGGAVGFSAIQLSVAAGCSVTTTCGSQSVDRALAAGAEQAVDYTTEVGYS